MGRFSEEDIERVKEENRLEDVIAGRVPVKRTGHGIWCRCPFHDEATPSFRVDENKQLWHCFGCGAGGDVIKFVMKADGLSFPQALRQLASRANIILDES